MSKDWKKVEEVLMDGGVAVIPTDTIYGVVARVLDKKAVERVYSVRGRDEKKPCIILISSYDDLNTLGIKLDKNQKEFLDKNWPGQVSIILPCNLKKFEYLHRGTSTLALRMIGSRNKNLLTLIKKVGPVIAPSANPQGLPPARNRKEARKYFDKNIDAYICYGTREGKPSTLVDLSKGKIEILRQGKVKIKHP
ncbi:MAG: threonylcarbamoyl-AMP synthase [Candidatus Pacebacteria bacterium]|nr:threonylcarbamoyl-AMP synthase [Candidatus Paceibacterota bacterium]MBP9715801.1 threonylcarbamoyl-AMP synthase [Candidatus Paceibacterota bacterium]